MRDAILLRDDTVAAERDKSRQSPTRQSSLRPLSRESHVGGVGSHVPKRLGMLRVSKANSEANWTRQVQSENWIREVERIEQLAVAERVGFVPGDPAPINNLRPFSLAQITRNAQNLSIRYKTGTA